MRQKMSTLIDPGLYRRVKVESARRNKQISEIVGEALEEYLASSRRGTSSGVVDATWRSIELEPARVRELLEEDEGLLET